MRSQPGRRQSTHDMSQPTLPPAASRSLPLQLLRTRESVMRRFRPLLRGTGMSEQQWRVLRTLGRAGSLEAGALAQATCLLAPSLSRILPDLQRRRLIVRRQLESDLRRSVISLDRKGVRLLSLYSPLSDRIHSDITRRFGSRRMAALLALLRELEAAAALAPKVQARPPRRG